MTDSRTVTLTISAPDARRLIAALYTCTPTGGGSDELNLLHRMSEALGISLDDMPMNALMSRYCENILDDAVEYGAAERLTPRTPEHVPNLG